MYKKAYFFVVLILFSSCTRIDFKSEELQPVQSNFSDGDLEVLVLTESTLVSREASEKEHEREEAFPPRVLIHLSADISYKNSSLEFKTVSLQSQDGSDIFSTSDISFTLRDSWYSDIEKYETYGHLKNLGGLNTVRDIFITPWLDKVELDQKYLLKLVYINLDGVEKDIEIDYRATSEVNRGFVPADAYWNSI